MSSTASYGALSNEEDADPELAWRVRNGLVKPAKRNDITKKLCIVGGGVGLSLSYAAERVTFKAVMDNLAPFRLFVAQVITLLYTLALAIPYGVTSVRRSDDGTVSDGSTVYFPLSKTQTMLIGFLEAVQLILMALPTPFVPPTLIVLLLQFSLPITVAISSFTTTNVVKPTWHYVGICLVLIGIVLAMFPLVFNPEGSQNGSQASIMYSSFMYLTSGVPAALSQAYKEKCIIAQNMHVCLHSLNFWVSLFQFAFLVILTPMVYAIKALSKGLSFYPLDGLNHDIDDGLKCCFTLYSTSVNDIYPEGDLQCDFALLFEFGYVVSVLLLAFCFQLIMTTSGKKHHRVKFIIGFGISYLAMVLYAEFSNNMSRQSVNPFNVAGAISIAGGMLLLL